MIELPANLMTSRKTNLYLSSSILLLYMKKNSNTNSNFKTNFGYFLLLHYPSIVSYDKKQWKQTQRTLQIGCNNLPSSPKTNAPQFNEHLERFMVEN